MGQKCSCLCNKENDSTFNFYPDGNNESDQFKETNKALNLKSGITANDVQKDREDYTKKEKEKEKIDYEKVLKENIGNIIMLQSFIRRHLSRKKFKKNQTSLKNKHNLKIKELEALFTSKINVSVFKCATKEFSFNGFDENKDIRNNLEKNEIENFKSIQNNIKQYISKQKMLKYECLQFKKEEALYIGNVTLNLERNGLGKLIKLNGDIYQGSWHKNKLNGYGRIYLNTNSKNNKTINLNSDNILGCIIEGKLYLILGFFIDGVLNSFGEKWYSNNTHYIGRILNNEKSGKGKEQCIEYNYEGMFKNDKKNGQGSIKYLLTNESYTGEFLDNSLTGKGEYIWSNGDKFIGDFLDGKMHGSGEYIWPEGGKYIGEYVNNIKEGRGIFYWTNGRIYDGEFSNGKPHGKGIIVQSDKRYLVEFVEGKIISKAKLNSSQYDDMSSKASYK